MKAIQLKELGSAPLLVDLPEPIEKEGFVKLNVSHSALNHRDVWIMKGQYAGLKYPIIPGSDASGYANESRKIINPGFYWGTDQKAQAKTFQILGLPEDGSFAEMVSVPESNLHMAPTHLDDAEAASIGLAGVTAYRALKVRCNPQPGERLLVTGIGGGVALFILQLATELGLETFVTSSDQIKIKKAKALGAAEGVLYTEEDWDQKLLSINPNGFDLIVDAYAGNSVNKLMKLVNPGGRICFYGGTGGKIQDLIPQQLFWKQISLLGSTMGSPLDFQEFLNWVHEKKMVPIVDSVYDLTNADLAFHRMSNREQFGKIVLRIKKS
ncbi:MAG: zinc-binding dehydrogenase [Saprospiraceae bacterium]|nr:zinc-binding dehydrogenase [Saprospiraceae bacterium]